jgi:hypothetical protein
MSDVFHVLSSWPISPCLILIIFYAWYNLRRSSLSSFLHRPATFTLLGSSILLSTLFTNTHCQCSSLRVRDQVSQPWKTVAKTKDLGRALRGSSTLPRRLYVLNLEASNRKVTDKTFYTEMWPVSSIFNLFLHYLPVSKKLISTFATFRKESSGRPIFLLPFSLATLTWEGTMHYHFKAQW